MAVLLEVVAKLPVVEWHLSPTRRKEQTRKNEVRKIF